MSGDPEQEYFADGIVEEIITALSRFKSLFVIARNSSFTFKGRVVARRSDAGLACAMSLRGLCARRRGEFASQGS
jgi:TolB-like protein